VIPPVVAAAVVSFVLRAAAMAADVDVVSLSSVFFSFSFGFASPFSVPSCAMDVDESASFLVICGAGGDFAGANDGTAEEANCEGNIFDVFCPTKFVPPPNFAITSAVAGIIGTFPVSTDGTNVMGGGCNLGMDVAPSAAAIAAEVVAEEEEGVLIAAVVAVVVVETARIGVVATLEDPTAEEEEEEEEALEESEGEDGAGTAGIGNDASLLGEEGVSSFVGAFAFSEVSSSTVLVVPAEVSGDVLSLGLLLLLPLRCESSSVVLLPAGP